ncbi:MAG: HAMP domain-containing histidine kinase [Promicromonosporaceae bacterium]|nr:HAMP domain-containing histidine kinase [Promicromonosporaceae bacterium]
MITVDPRLAPGLSQARIRLTALYAALFAASGAVLLTVVNLLMRRSLPGSIERFAGQMRGYGAPQVYLSGGVGPGGVVPDYPGRLGGPGVAIGAGAGGELGGPAVAVGGEVLTIANVTLLTSTELLRWSLLVFLALLAISVVLGYWLSGRLLAPIQGAFAREQRLVATMSHELRTPLTTQRAVLETAFDPDFGALDDPAALVTAADEALSQNARANRIIEGMLTLARLGNAGREGKSGRLANLVRIGRSNRSGGSALDQVSGSGTTTAPVNLTELVSAVVKEHDDDATSHGVSVTVTGAENVLVNGDPVLLERLVDNLIANAIIHNITGNTDGPRGDIGTTGPVDSGNLGGDTAMGGQVNITLESSNGRATFTVSNTGPILDPETVSKLTLPFRRGATDRTVSDRSTGLGLTIASEIAHYHGGQLELKANPTGGLTATVTW